jgi:hypothetical protein
MRGIVLASLMVIGGSASVVAQDGSAYDPYADLVISRDVSKLPQDVQAMRTRLLKAATGGDIGALKTIIDAQSEPPTLSFGGADDPIAFLKSASADGNGVELLAIMANMLSAPYAIIGATSPDPSYVWPYLAAADVSKLTPEQWVDAYRLLPAETAKDLPEAGSYYYWRVFIDENGDWSAFVAGD